jgi:hypothetical protein
MKNKRSSQAIIVEQFQNNNETLKKKLPPEQDNYQSDKR